MGVFAAGNSAGESACFSLVGSIEMLRICAMGRKVARKMLSLFAHEASSDQCWTVLMRVLDSVDESASSFESDPLFTFFVHFIPACPIPTHPPHPTHPIPSTPPHPTPTHPHCSVATRRHSCHGHVCFHSFRFMHGLPSLGMFEPFCCVARSFCELSATCRQPSHPWRTFLVGWIGGTSTAPRC